MREINEQQMYQCLESDGSFILFLYTPLCGTCKHAEHMLLPLQTWYEDVSFVKANINMTPRFVKEEKVKSVPCLKVIKQGTIMKTIYAFHSIPSLIERIHPVLSYNREET